jgi:hemolysin III
MNRAILAVTLGFSVAAALLLAIVVAAGGDPREAAATLVYAATLVACSLASFLYHTLERARRRAVLRRLDHAAIFLLIAGTYTPFAVDGVPGPFGGTLLEWVWGLAVAGVILKLLLGGAYERVFIGLYLGIGWFVVLAFRELARVTPPAALLLLALGGVIYTAGAVIFARDRGHWTPAVWHGCVLAGSFTHFLAVLAALASAPDA